MNQPFKPIALLLITCGLLALLLGDKPAANLTGLNFDEYDQIIQAPVPQISAIELAEYLIKQEHHYHLIDLQRADAHYQIPTAARHTVDNFLQSKVPVNQTIFIYSEHEAKAMQLYYLLNIRGYFKVKVLTGGLAQWTQQILQPNIDTIPIEQQPHRRQLTDFFGGSFNQNMTTISPKIIKLEKKVKVHHGC